MSGLFSPHCESTHTKRPQLLLRVFFSRVVTASGHGRAASCHDDDVFQRISVALGLSHSRDDAVDGRVFFFFQAHFLRHASANDSRECFAYEQSDLIW